MYSPTPEHCSGSKAALLSCTFPSITRKSSVATSNLKYQGKRLPFLLLHFPVNRELKHKVKNNLLPERTKIQRERDITKQITSVACGRSTVMVTPILIHTTSREHPHLLVCINILNDTAAQGFAGLLVITAGPKLQQVALAALTVNWNSHIVTTVTASFPRRASVEPHDTKAEGGQHALGKDMRTRCPGRHLSWARSISSDAALGSSGGFRLTSKKSHPYTDASHLCLKPKSSSCPKRTGTRRDDPEVRGHLHTLSSIQEPDQLTDMKLMLLRGTTAHVLLHVICLLARGGEHFQCTTNGGGYNLLQASRAVPTYLKQSDKNQGKTTARESRQALVESRCSRPTGQLVVGLPLLHLRRRKRHCVHSHHVQFFETHPLPHEEKCTG
ncbi:hypothetical protein Anapl_15301 [Anas platyrhynchos]|uniref:Uncharacterized protein n=1 Tax=Anas platyrhynchos TaxID=8839 RepID=R0K4J1_ANAPL|nr:hypothetical protein Anapl_15301 [Anas platyrhynchos]